MRKIIIFFIATLFFPLCIVAEENNEEAKTADSLEVEKSSIQESKYFSVTLPKGWKTIKSPEEEHGNVTAIFATENESCTITIIMGPTLGAEPKAIASMFADQFQAQKPPVLKNNQYIFTFIQHGIPVEAEVSSNNDVFRLITINGDKKTALEFINKQFSFISMNENDELKAPETAKEEKKADKAGSSKDSEEKKEEGNKAAAANEKKDKASQENKTEEISGKQTASKEDNEYKCEFYTVTLPKGWRAILPPTEEVGNINAIFADSSNAIVITIIIGPRLGSDASEIAAIFAEQFKATEPPEKKNDQYLFYFPQNGATARAIVKVDGNFFLIATTIGNEREIKKFFSNNIKTEHYTGLIPR